MGKHWVIEENGGKNIVPALLLRRGVTDVERFLYPDYERDTFPYSAFTRMNEAVTRLFAALSNGESIVIHGDYDADGVCGAALLYSAILEIVERTPAFKGQPRGLPLLDVFLPDREKDGYGVAMHTVERLAEEGVTLLITVDCGIANGLELDRGHELGMDAIVCDHHQLGEHTPRYATLLHPLAPGETYPNKTLCGTGVAFKFASALVDEAHHRGADFPAGHEKWFLDLVAIATVTDVMPLVGENRALETFGLKVLAKTKRPGLRALAALSSLDLGEVTTEDIGFRLGPRLNAAGRLASARLAFDTLVAADDETAMRCATDLETLNRKRQTVFAAEYKEARQQLDAREGTLPTVIVVWSETWTPGIVGLIAGRLVGDYGRPAFALTRSGDAYVGSGRSLGGLHLVEAMNACGDVFVRKGGHPQACGLTIATEENIRFFDERMQHFATQHFGENGVRDDLVIDASVTPADISWELYNSFMALAPFGEGNREPVLAMLGVEVVDVRTMGADQKHVRLTVRGRTGTSVHVGEAQDVEKISLRSTLRHPALHQSSVNTVCKLVGFGFAERCRNVTIGSTLDVACTLGVNEWNGNRELQLRIVDVRVSPD